MTVKIRHYESNTVGHGKNVNDAHAVISTSLRIRDHWRPKEEIGMTYLPGTKAWQTTYPVTSLGALEPVCEFGTVAF